MTIFLALDSSLRAIQLVEREEVLPKLLYEILGRMHLEEEATFTLGTIDERSRLDDIDEPTPRTKLRETAMIAVDGAKRTNLIVDQKEESFGLTISRPPPTNFLRSSIKHLTLRHRQALLYYRADLPCRDVVNYKDFDGIVHSDTDTLKRLCVPS